MRLLHCTDFHFVQPWFEWLARQASEFDVVCLSGDLLDLDVHLRVHPREQVRWITAWAQTFPGTLCLCSGNHDTVSGIALLENAHWMHRLKRPTVAVDGDVIAVDDFQIECVPWSGIPVASPSADIALVHAPPAGTLTSLSQRERRDFGDPELADLLLRMADAPSLLLCGHIHWPSRWYDRRGRTLILNPGCLPTDPWPAHIELDLDKRTALRRAHNRNEQRVSLR